MDQHPDPGRCFYRGRRVRNAGNSIIIAMDQVCRCRQGCAAEKDQQTCQQRQRGASGERDARRRFQREAHGIAAASPGQDRRQRQQDEGVFVKAGKHQRGPQGDRGAAGKTARGNGQVESAQVQVVRAASIDFPMNEHADQEEHQQVAENKQGTVR